MKITEFRNKIAKAEGKKIEISIAQISEVLRIIDMLTAGMLYKLIRKL